MPTTERPLIGKVAIVTGAGRGIGKAIACAYARAGAAVCCAARTAAEVDETVQDIVASGGQGLAVPTDVTQLAAVQRMVQITSDRFGGLDILVINAAVGGETKAVEDGHPEGWRTTLEINLLGAYYCAHSAIPALKNGVEGRSLPWVRASAIVAGSVHRTMHAQRQGCGCSHVCWPKNSGRIILA